MPPKDRYQQVIESGIRSIVERQQIRYLLHFTPLESLPFILAYGIRPRADLIKAGVAVSYRLDEEDEAVSVSVTCFYPKMFEAKRIRSGGRPSVILGLRPDVLWSYPCRFYAQGIPTSSTKHEGHKRHGHWALEKLFEDHPAGFRSAHDLPPSVPTRSDAEVQVMSSIDPSHIVSAWVENDEHGEAVGAVCDAAGRADCEVFVRSFEPRIRSGLYSWG